MRFMRVVRGTAYTLIVGGLLSSGLGMTGDLDLTPGPVTEQATVPSLSVTTGWQLTGAVAPAMESAAESATVDRSEAVPGDVVTFHVMVANNGSAPFASPSLVDDLSQVLDDADPAGQPTATFGDGSPAGMVRFGKHDGLDALLWNGPDLPAAPDPRGPVTISYQVKLPDPPKSGDWVLDNRVIAGGSACVDAPQRQPGCAASVTVAYLGVTKTVNPPQPRRGEEAIYTVEIRNPGSAEFLAGAVVTDDLSDVLDDAEIKPGGEPAVVTGAGLGDLAYDATAQRWTWTAKGKLPPLAPVTITYTVLLPADPGRGNAVLGNDVLANFVQTTPARGSMCKQGTGADPKPCRTESRVDDRAVPAVIVTKNHDRPVGARPDEVVSYTIVADNSGGVLGLPDPALVADLSGKLDDAEPWGTPQVTLDSGDPAGTVAFDVPGQWLTWSDAPELPAGAKATITYQVKVNDPPTGDQVMTSSVTMDGSNCAADQPDSRCATEVRVLVHGVKLGVTTEPAAQAFPGDAVTFLITVRGDGADVPGYTFTDDLRGVLPYASMLSTPDELVAQGFTLEGDHLVWRGDVTAAGRTLSYRVRVNPPGDVSRTENGHRLADRLEGERSNCPASNSNAECSAGPAIGQRPVTPVPSLRHIPVTGSGHLPGLTVAGFVMLAAGSVLLLLAVRSRRDSGPG